MSYYPQPDDGMTKPTDKMSANSVSPSPPKAVTESSFERATLRWTRAMFFATAATGAFIGFQWFEMHQSGTNSIEIARNDQRAWVGIGGIPVSALKLGEQITVQIPYNNTGKSLALDVRTRSFATVEDPQFNPNDFISMHSNEPFLQPIVVFPGIPATSMSIVVPVADANAMAEGVRSGEKHFYVIGEIRYKDIFERPHFTQFCGEYSTKTPGNLISCKEYNTAN